MYSGYCVAAHESSAAIHASRLCPVYTGLMRFMPSRLLALLLFAMLLGAGCTTSREQLPPTPFPTSGPVQITPTAGEATLTIGEVASALGLYRDAPIIVSGRLRRQPLLVCDSEPHPSPATWSLTDDGAVLLAARFEDQVRQLLPEDLTMTVAGRLRLWEGPVGCGKQAQTQEVWYLEVSRILSPSPLTQATLTPEGFAVGVTEIAEVQPTESLGDGLTPEFATEEPTPDLTEPTATSAPEVAFPTAQTAPTLAPTEVTPALSGTPLTTPTAATTVVATATLAGTATETPGPGTPTATSAVATSTTAAGQVTQMGDVYDVEGDFPTGTLSPGEVHSWTLEIFEGELYDIKAIAPVPANVTLSLWRDGQALIDRQNISPAGSPEVMVIGNRPEGMYEIRVQTDASSSTQYMMVLSIPGDYEQDLLGFLAPGAARSNVTLPEVTYHFWNITAAPGARVTITVTPNALADPFITLYAPDGGYAADVDVGFAGDVEVLEYTVEQGGLHTILVEEIDGNEMQYSIVLAVQQ